MNPATTLALLLLVLALAAMLGRLHDRRSASPTLLGGPAAAALREQRARATLRYFTDVHDSA